MIQNTMNIGCLCEGFLFADLFRTRIKGPVDNFEGYNFKSILKLFDGSLFNAILSNKVDSRESFNDPENNNDGFIRYYCSEDNVLWGNNGQPIEGDYGWKVIHNNLEKEENKEEFKKRINNFNNFNNNIERNSYYIYTISANDLKLSEEDFNYVINHLPSSVIEKLIVISAVRYNTPKLFYENFRCINYNKDLTGENKIPKVNWNIY